MISFQQRVLLLPLQLFVLLLLPYFSFAQSSNGTTSLFSLEVGDIRQLCTLVSLVWSGGNTVPAYRITMARGIGAIGDENSLGPESVVALINSNTVNELLYYIDSSITNLGEVIRFRIQDNWGTGVSAVAWTIVSDSICDSEGFEPQTSPISQEDDGSGVTTKNVNGIMPPTAAESMTRTGVGLPLTATTLIRGPSTSPQGPSAPSRSSPVPTRTDTGFGQGDRASPSNTSGPGDGSGQLSPSGSQQDSRNSSDPPVGGSGATNRPSIVNGQGSQSSQTVAPNNSSGQSDTAPKQTSLSVQAIGAIVGTILIAILILVAFVIWRRRQQKRPVALSSRESPRGGSTRELLTPASETFDYAQRPPMLEVPTTARNQTHSLAPPPIIVGHGGAVVPSYDEATSLYSPLNTPDPFRNVFDISQNTHSNQPQATWT